MKKEYLPNLFTLLRIILIGPIVISLFLGHYKLALWLFIFTGFTDAIDGYLARKLCCVSRWGAMVDPLADKLLIILTLISLAILGWFPLWLLLCLGAREIIIVLGAIIYHFLIGPYEFAPTQMSKLNTCLQLVLVVGIMVKLSGFHLSQMIIKLLILSVFITSLWSLLDYVWTWGRAAWLHYQRGSL